MTERTQMTAMEEMDQIEFVHMLDTIHRGFNLFTALTTGDSETVESILNKNR